MRAVNLLPADSTRGRRWGAGDRGAAKRVFLTAAVVAAVLVAALGAAFVHAHSSAADKQETLNGLEQKVVAAQTKAAAVQAARRVGSSVLVSQMEKRWLGTKLREKRFDVALRD